MAWLRGHRLVGLQQLYTGITCFAAPLVMLKLRQSVAGNILVAKSTTFSHVATRLTNDKICDVQRAVHTIELVDTPEYSSKKAGQSPRCHDSCTPGWSFTCD